MSWSFVRLKSAYIKSVKINFLRWLATRFSLYFTFVSVVAETTALTCETVSQHSYCKNLTMCLLL